MSIIRMIVDRQKILKVPRLRGGFRPSFSVKISQLFG
jgi:hypothetical protein